MRSRHTNTFAPHCMGNEGISLLGLDSWASPPPLVETSGLENGRNVCLYSRAVKPKRLLHSSMIIGDLSNPDPPARRRAREYAERLEERGAGGPLPGLRMHWENAPHIERGRVFHPRTGRLDLPHRWSPTPDVPCLTSEMRQHEPIDICVDVYSKIHPFSSEGRIGHGVLRDDDWDAQSSVRTQP